MSMINPTKLILFVLLVLVLEVIAINGIVPSAYFDDLLSAPPTYSQVGWWDAWGVASALWYGLSILFWAITKPVFLIIMAIQLLYFSGITVVTLINSMLSIVLFIVLIFLIRGSD